MAVQIISAGSVPNNVAGSQFGLVINSDGSLNNYQVGLNTFQVIRQDSGSPAVNYVFSSIANSFLIHNLGSSPIYYNINAGANPANSGTAWLAGSDAIGFNFKAGSVSIQGSGLTSPPVQVIRIS